MRKIAKCAAIALLLSSLSAVAQAKRDPLSPAEVTELRESAQEPDKRLAAFVRFLRERSDALDKLRTDPRFTGDRLGQVHDRLEDITLRIDEMDDNVETYAAQKADLRKPLKAVIELDTDQQARLRALKENGVATQSKADGSKRYAFVLQNAQEAVDMSLDGARRTLRETEERIKADKEAQKKKK
jgi:hypothetical protein